MNLNIVTLNVPFPPDYGGMIDTYYRIRTLHELGICIHLHCFEYGRQHSQELESLCETTSYYPRESGLLRQFSSLPYIVFSRKSKKLMDNLISNDYPILFDGLHTTFYINLPLFRERKKLVRLHNIEHKYYRALATNESNPFRKAYYLLEAAKLKRYEKVLAMADYIMPISESDQKYFSSKYNNSVFMAPFHPYYRVKSLQGIGDYIIYHGDLSVNENSAIAESLISNVFSKIPFNCVIAGKDPSETIFSLASQFKNIKVIPNPGIGEMENLIVNAQINLLPALTNNGFKLKLLMALYAGRHLLINSIIAENFSIQNICYVANSFEEIINEVHHLMEEPFTKEIILVRQRALSETFDIRKNAEILKQLIFGERSI